MIEAPTVGCEVVEQHRDKVTLGRDHIESYPIKVFRRMQPGQ